MNRYLKEKRRGDEPLAEHARDHLISVPEIKPEKDLGKLVDFVLSGDIILIMDGEPEGLVISSRGWEARSVSEPEAEPLVRGPRDGFTENIRTNTSLIRRRLKTSRLKLESLEIGSITKTAVIITYIDGIVNEKLVAEVRERLARIKTDSILESGYLEQFIEDNPWSLFSQVDVTERPDKVWQPSGRTGGGISG